MSSCFVISTVLMTIGVVVTWVALPSSFTIFNFGARRLSRTGSGKHLFIKFDCNLETNLNRVFHQLFLCVGVGLWGGLIIGYVTEYYTSNAYRHPFRQSESLNRAVVNLTNPPLKLVLFWMFATLCKMLLILAALELPPMLSLALDYKSVIIPIFAIVVSIFISFSFATMYGIVVAAFGRLSTIDIGLAINAYGPISDNAGCVAEMAWMSHRVRED